MLRFGAFALDPGRHLLTRDGQIVSLSPHLVDILGHLASHAGELVTKDALLERFWPDVSVTENTLTRAIADIRKALGDSATAPRFIQTVARRGYRFVADGAGLTLSQEDPLRDFVRGRAALEALDASTLPEAILAFEQAVSAMPEYAPAHTGLASGCFLQYEATRATNSPDREPLRRAIAHARRACELDASLGEAWATLGYVLAAAGQLEEARVVTRRAAALEPTSWRHQFRLSLASWGEERLRACDRTLSLLPDFAPARFAAAMVFTARQAFGPAMRAAAAGATAQSRQPVHQASPFPSIGLHWLRGLLLLRERQVGLAIESFAREMDELREAQVYAGEFRVNAQVAAGFAHLAASDATGAIDAFRMSLETLPRNGRALIGLYSALRQTTLSREADWLLPQIGATIAELAAGHRVIEAAIVRAAAEISQGQADTACATLEQLLVSAPPGQAGWQIPIDPALAPLRSHPHYPRIVALLAARAT
ncbi:MAG TPA: transcriptional regulator [Vicinamibacterales bacterium]|nr:transcriptional regulator [Vicinamibacterales bacterium]